MGLFVFTENASPVICPFTEAYYFHYDATGGDFRSCGEKSLSYAKPCIGYDKYQLHFLNCDKSAKYHNTGNVLRHWV